MKDYRQAIRERLAETWGSDVDRVSVKFKTAEKVGPVGEGRSAESQAIVTLVAKIAPVHRVRRPSSPSADTSAGRRGGPSAAHWPFFCFSAETTV